MRCANCGQENPEGFRFCGRCGHPLEVAAAPEERKVVTVLFADMTGSTALGERLDAERLKDVMSAYFSAMRQEIEAEGGTVEKFIGDAVMAVFGVPAAHEDDPARALRAATRMQARLAELNDELRPVLGGDLQIRIGVNTGEVMAVTVPTPGEAMVSGDAVNVAARLEQTATPGSVVVSERTARATRGFSFRPLGSLELRGKGRGVTALELAGERPGLPERGIPGLRAPMVGRDDELELLRSLYRRVASDGAPALVTILGDAGIGKSRLVSEFESWTESADPPALVLKGRCLPYGEGITYWPLAEILKGQAGVLDTDPPDVTLEKIQKLGMDLFTADVAADPARATAALAYTVGVEDPAFDFTALPPRQVRLSVHSAWRSFFSALAASGPVVVVVEDIHWADSALLDLLEELADRVQGPVLLVCPARPELTARRPTWGGGRRSYSSLFLDPLSPDDARGLVELLLSVADLPGAVRSRILSRAEGNPFYLEEIIRGLIDSGRIGRDGDVWRATEGIADVQIPDTVQGVLAARLDLLQPADKRVLQLAAVVGRTFWTEPVARLLGEADGDLAGAFERLEDRELILSRLGSVLAGQQEFVFKHVLTRDVAYETLPRRDRVAAHAEAVRWFEETVGDRREEFVELFAYHYLEAYRGAREDGRFDPAGLEHLRVSGFEAALQACDAARSKMAVSKAGALGEQAEAVSATPLERARALEALAFTYLADYQGDQSWRTFREAADLRSASVPDDGRAIARLCARALESPVRWPGSMRHPPTMTEAEPYLERGLAACPPGDGEERARLLTDRGFWSFAFEEARTPEGLEASDRSAREGVDMARRLGRVDLELAALDAVSSISTIQGLYAGHWPLVERRLRLVERYEDFWEYGDAYALASWHTGDVGKWREAARFGIDGAKHVLAEIPGIGMHALARACIGLFHTGEWDDLLAAFARIREALGERADGPPAFVSVAYAVALVASEARGESVAADRLLPVIENIGRDRRIGTPTADPFVARFLGRRGRWEEAFAQLDRHADDSSVRAHVFAARCDLLADAGRWDEAEAFVKPARAWAELAGLEALPFFADRLEGRLLRSRGEDEAAIAAMERAAEGFHELDAPWEQAVTELHLAEALVGQGRDAREPLERGLLVFERIGALREAETARALADRG